MKTMLNKLLSIIAIASFSVTVFPSLVFASHEITAEYQYLIGTGALCDLPIPNPCPVISKMDNGDTVEITGSGTLSINPNSVTGGGNFVHKDGLGNVVGSGIWVATELVKFRSWGTQPDLPSNFEGGKARMRVHLTATDGLEFDATLKIFCLIGDIRAGTEEGIQLRIRGAPDFNEIVSGLTLFIRTN